MGNNNKGTFITTAVILSIMKKKLILMGGLLLALSACSNPKIELKKSYQNNTESMQSEEITKISSTNNDKNTLIVLSPHFDDAILSVGGIISEFNDPKYIITFFSTPFSTPQYLTNWDKMSGFKKSTEARAIREQENRTAATTLGANVTNIDYIDNQYEKRSSTDNSSLIQSMTRDIGQIIESASNTNAELTIIGPSYFGEKITHPDHLLVSKAFIQAVKNKCYTNVHFYFYEDLPYTHKRFGEEEVTLDKLLTDFYSGLQLDKQEIFISQQAFDSKREGIKLYTSQVKALNSQGEDIIQIITQFGMNRCPQFPLPQKPCEVIYLIKEMQ